MPPADDLTALVRRYKNEDGQKARQTMESMLALPGAAHRVFDMIFGPEQRAALRALADMCRKKIVKEEMAPLITGAADKLAGIEDVKARKTAYVLMGLCAPNACADTLAEALMNEKIRFVRPSIILALGNTENPEKYLSGYVIEPGEPKHMEAEREALKKAMGKAAEPQALKDLRLPEWCAVTYIKRIALEKELGGLGLPYRPGPDDMITVRTADLGTLRCYEDALYDIGAFGEYEKAAKTLNTIGCAGALYRIEAGCLPVQKRRDAIRAITEGLFLYGYEDNPSAYAFEILLKGGRMLAKFMGDSRFAYRKKAVPASINPVTAASIMRLCRPYMHEAARVLDPFCGSGTMLIERALAMKTETLVGVDISSEAIRAACENRRASGQKIALIHGDALQFGGSQYDEVVSNMPFGLRVSGHESNERLYAAFALRLSKLLVNGGHAFLFTMEKKLLRDAVRDNPGMNIIQEEIFESGGLSPSLYIIKKEQ